MTRDEAIQVLTNFYVSTKNPKANHLCEAVYIAIQALKDEPKHGRWEKKGISIKGIEKEFCSECKTWSYGRSKAFCPNCGAKVDEVEE